MTSPTLETLRNKIRQLKHAILKPVQQEPCESYMVETLGIAEDGTIFCTSKDIITNQAESPFDVTLKYLDKEQGEYVLIHGSASKQKYAFLPKMEIEANNPVSTLKIKIQTAQYFEKQELPAFASNLKKKVIWKLKYGWASLLRKTNL
jgi:hypothetical protein